MFSRSYRSEDETDKNNSPSPSLDVSADILRRIGNSVPFLWIKAG